MDKEPIPCVCKYCGRENSTDHETCPGCGAPVRRERGMWDAVAALALSSYLHPDMNLVDYLEIHNGTVEGSIYDR